jgi:hypothetical protein
MVAYWSCAALLIEAIFQLFWNVQNANDAECVTPAFFKVAPLVGLLRGGVLIRTPFKAFLQSQAS